MIFIDNPVKMIYNYKCRKEIKQNGNETSCK